MVHIQCVGVCVSFCLRPAHERRSLKRQTVIFLPRLLFGSVLVRTKPVPAAWLSFTPAEVWDLGGCHTLKGPFPDHKPYGYEEVFDL